MCFFFFFQAEDGIRDRDVTGVQTCALPISQFTVYNYDRRGRADSGDTPPYAVEREMEDIETLIAEAGGSAHLYGVSSGGAHGPAGSAIAGCVGWFACVLNFGDVPPGIGLAAVEIGETVNLRQLPAGQRLSVPTRHVGIMRERRYGSTDERWTLEN